MRLNDIWRRVHEEIGFYTKETFSNVPSVPGVYAWFYPLRIVDRDPYSFIDEVNTILNYDANLRGKPVQSNSVYFRWKKLNCIFGIDFKSPNLSHVIKIWEKAANNDEEFTKLRRIIMKASIFIPPLYVGKTINLKIRCQQHINGNDRDNDFHRRFTEFACKNNVFAKRVSDLLFVCLKTNENQVDKTDNFEGLVEEMIKTLSKPAYSIK